MQNVSRSGIRYPIMVHNIQSPALKQTCLPYIRYQGFAGIRDNPLSRIHPLGGWWKVESTMLECRKACCCSGIIVTRKSVFLLLSSFNTDLDTKCPLLAKGKNAKADYRKHAKRFPFWRERGTASRWLVVESRIHYVNQKE